MLRSLCLLLLVAAVAVEARRYSYKIKGKFVCGDRPMNDIKVKLVEKDKLRDDDFGEVRTNGDGSWELSGEVSKSLIEALSSDTLDIVLKVYHRCLGDSFRDGPVIGSRRTDFFPPNDHVNKGNFLDLGTVNLETWLTSSEETDII